MAKDFKIDPETGEVKYNPSVVTLLTRLSDKNINQFFRETAESDPELKSLYREFTKIRKGLADHIRTKYMNK